MSYENLFNLTGNPFRMTPAISSEEIYWAGFPSIKEQFEKLIKRSMRIPNSSLVLNWGEYGSGKTHAARYFGKDETLSQLAEEVNSAKPYFVFLTLPKGRSPINDLYTAIVDKIDIDYFRELFANDLEDLANYINTIDNNSYIQAVLKAIFQANVDSNLLKRYLYQSTSASENKSLSEQGIMRGIGSETDYSKIIAGLFSCITFQKKYFSTIIFWVDEFEDIAIMTKVNADKTNSFLREIIDNTPNNLLIFLNLTQSALFNIEDLGEYISEAVKSRIKTRINFEIPKREDTIEYIKELLSFYRVDPANAGRSELFPYEQDMLIALLNKLGNAALRSVNETLGLLLDIAEMDEISPITIDYYNEHEAEIIGNWKN